MPVTQPTTSRSGRIKLLRRLILVVSLAILAITFRKPLFQGNFGVVDPGRVFRSAQPGGAFPRTIAREGLGSVINLRGGSNADPFYRDEVEVSKRYGIEFYDIPMSASRRPSRNDLLRALAVLDQCRYPTLIHCKWGSDRTGLMCALYRLDKLGEPPEEAIKAFTVTYGHFPFFGPERLHEPLDEYSVWLRSHSLTHNSDRFRSWLERDYRSDDPFQGWPIVRPGTRPVEAIAARPAPGR